MDAGAGIIIPNVVSAEQVQFAYQATRYPPEGVRGVGLARTQNYGQGSVSIFNGKLMILLSLPD